MRGRPMSPKVTQPGRVALQRLSEAYRAQLARHIENMTDEALDAWERQEEKFLRQWSDELDGLRDRGVEYEMMLDIQLVTRQVVRKHGRESKNAKAT